ncbi:MAG: hypothetical protein ACLFN5_01545 [bacterium]
MLTVKQYYADPEVRKRMLEYSGAESGVPEDVTAVYMVGFGPSFTYRQRPYESAPPEWGFNWFVEEGLDIFRSTWDKDGLMAIFDVEYVNHDDPALMYHNPEYGFSRLEPLVELARDFFAGYGMEPMVLITGQGYHFSFQITKGSKTYKKLADIGSVLPSLAGKYSVQQPELPLEEGAAYDGLGRVFEFIAGRFIAESGGGCGIPLTIGDPVPGPSFRGREQLNLDLSAFADPLFMRDVRVPFSSHQKHRVYVHKVGDYIRRSVPPQYTIPRRGLNLRQLLDMRRNPGAVQEYAREVKNCTIPVENRGFSGLIDDYLKSGIYEAHREFDSGFQDPYYFWPETYDRVSAGQLPHCLAESLRVPNPRLLEPTHIQSFVRWFCDRGWHPQDVAGLIRSKFERNYNWDEDWYHYDAATRAAVWVRMYYTLIASGRDCYTDMNCISFQERGICTRPFCGWNVGSRP